MANNAGWAVDDFGLELPVGAGEAYTEVFPTLKYAVGDTHGYLLRVAYTITVVGHYGKLGIISQ